MIGEGNADETALLPPPAATVAKTRTQLNRRLAEGKKLPWPPFGPQWYAGCTTLIIGNSAKAGIRTLLLPHATPLPPCSIACGCARNSFLCPGQRWGGWGEKHCWADDRGQDSSRLTSTSGCSPTPRARCRARARRWRASRLVSLRACWPSRRPRASRRSCRSLSPTFLPL